MLSRPRDPRRALVALLVVLFTTFALVTTAAAHGIGMSQLRLSVDGARLTGAWEMDLRDSRLALGLDPTITGAAGWNELKAHEAEYRAVLDSSLRVQADSAACTFHALPDSVTYDAKLNTVIAAVEVVCPKPPNSLQMHCDLLFARDPKHRAYFSIEDERVTSIGAFHVNVRDANFKVHQFDLWGIVREFIAEGTHHIWSGIDHMMFLLALLLPAPLMLLAGQWQRRATLSGTLREVLKVVTAFTAAHSITLSLAYFGVIRLPSQWVEVGIAVSVFMAAWNNIRPFLPERAWAMAFGFGLVHGMGFAGALGNLSLPRHARVLALAAFNVGVELGQLVLVLVALPVLYLLSRNRAYPRWVMGLGSLVIAWISVLWVLERAFGLTLFAHR